MFGGNRYKKYLKETFEPYLRVIRVKNKRA